MHSRCLTTIRLPPASSVLRSTLTLKQTNWSALQPMTSSLTTQSKEFRCMWPTGIWTWSVSASISTQRKSFHGAVYLPRSLLVRSSYQDALCVSTRPQLRFFSHAIRIWKSLALPVAPTSVCIPAVASMWLGLRTSSIRKKCLAWPRQQIKLKRSLVRHNPRSTSLSKRQHLCNRNSANSLLGVMFRTTLSTGESSATMRWIC